MPGVGMMVIGIFKRWAVQLVAFIIFNLNAFRFKVAWFPRCGLIYPALYCYSCPYAVAGCPFGIFQKSVISLKEGFSTWNFTKAIALFPFYLIGVIIAYGILFGRGFCGWLCPFGFLQDLFGKFNRKERITKNVDRKLKYIKYFVLAASLILAAIFLDTIFCKLCPSATFFAAVPYGILFGQGLTTIWYLSRIFIFAILMLLLVFLAKRFWCRYLCPVGALFAPFNKISLMKIKIDRKLCTACNACTKVCPMGIDVLKDHVEKNKQRIDSLDCIICRECSKACPTGCLKLKWK
jgi:ferredoxin-type protein NapH